MWRNRRGARVSEEAKRLFQFPRRRARNPFRAGGGAPSPGFPFVPAEAGRRWGSVSTCERVVRIMMSRGGGQVGFLRKPGIALCELKTLFLPLFPEKRKRSGARRVLDAYDSAFRESLAALRGERRPAKFDFSRRAPSPGLMERWMQHKFTERKPEGI